MRLRWLAASILAVLPHVAQAQDSCAFALDGECDELQFGGTGACLDGTDTTDCTGTVGPEVVDGPVLGGDDSCVWANDGECDDPNLGGTGACSPGTDASDCSGGVAQAIPTTGGDDSCIWANDGECDDPNLARHRRLCPRHGRV